MNRMLFFSIAILIIIVMMILFPKHLCTPKKWQCEQHKNTINMMKDITSVLKQFQAEQGYFPRNLEVLTKSLGKTQLIYLEKIKTDKWANPFIYAVKEKKILLYSVGINSKDEFGKGDDITFESEQNKNVYCD